MAEEIRPYQEEAIQAAIARGNLLLALVMGSGKTRVAIEIVKRLRAQQKVVGASAFVQNSTKFQWSREVEHWDPGVPVQVINGTKKQRTLQFHRAHEYAWTILNYEALVHDWDLIQEFLPIDAVVADECTLIKSFVAKRTKRIKKLSAYAGYRFAMSGQPVENRPEELFSIMEFVDTSVLGPFHKFDRTFITRDAFGRPLRYKNLDVLQQRLGDAMYRRSRSDLAAYLPKVQTIDTPVLLDAWSKKVYAHIRDDLLGVIDMAVAAGVGGFDLAGHYGRGGALDEQGNQFKGMIMSRVTCMRLLCDHPQLLMHSAETFDDPDSPKGSAFASELQLLGLLDGAPLTSPKLDLLMARIQEALGEDPTNKVVVFSGFKPMLSLIGLALKKAKITCTRIDGDVPSKIRDQRIVRFNTDPACRVFLSSDAGAYGVNLDSGSHLVSYDLPWSSGSFSQRVARIDRLSSVHRSITIDNMFCAGTIEERQYAMLQQKRKVSEAFIDGQFDAQGVLELNLSSLRKFLEEA